MKKICLNQHWNLSWTDMDSPTPGQQNHMSTKLPCDIHMPLLENKIIKEPTLADYSYESEWTEEKAWWFSREINISEDMLNTYAVELVLERLDGHATIWINDTEVGSHINTHYPFRKNIKEHIKPGVNHLLVRLTSGAENVDPKELEPIKNHVATEGREGRGDRGDIRRALLRKPQYVFGWDWGPRCVTCGITGEAWLEIQNQVVIRNIVIGTKKIEESTAHLQVAIELENFDQTGTTGVTLEYEVERKGKTILRHSNDLLITSGIHYLDLELEIENPELWWPRGMGEQALYTFKTNLNGESGYKPLRFGIRTSQLLMDKVSDKDWLFAIKINGIPTYCRGGNWIPADSIYARIPDEKYKELITEACNANFNMLRVWGGGFFERDCFYETCDQLGIMVWQDFMFGCALVPDYLDWFMDEVRKELDYQTKRYGSHPSIVLWCGNNENHTAYRNWWAGEGRPKEFHGALIYNYLMPEICRKNTPLIPYWNSSPYGGANPDSYEAGDVHCWGETVMNPDMSVKINPFNYDKITAKFVAEYGYVGPCKKSTIVKYHHGAPIERDSRIWQLHNNTFEKHTVNAGITHHYTDAQSLDLDDYLLYGGLVQGTMLGYSLETFRFNLDNYGGLFWMFNDCWGEVGWTIIDYYLTRKISYYFVKRAFDPMRFVLRRQGNKVIVMLANDTAHNLEVSFNYGYLSFDGKEKTSKVASAKVEAFSRKHILEIDLDWLNLSENQLNSGSIFVWPIDNHKVLPACLYTNTIKNLNLPDAQLEIKPIDPNTFEVSSKVFAHAVHFKLDDSIRLSDEYFDLLPGESRRISILDGPINTNEVKAYSVKVPQSPQVP